MSLTVLLVDDEENFRQNLEPILTEKGFEVLAVGTLEEARKHIQKGSADVVLLDVQLPDGYGPDLLEEFAQATNRPPIILITAYGDIDMAVSAMKNGAHDFLQKPIKLDRLERTLARAGEVVQMRRELAHYRRSSQREVQNFHIGNSDAMQTVVDQARRAADSSVSVLLTGATGTGKEVLARAIHQWGPRAEKPFIGENCAAIQTTMLESILFGHEEGAFTSATRKNTGLMEVANGGILFLDEIASMPVDMQAKILRALEEQAFRRVGGDHLIQVDVQIIAASNRNLSAMIEQRTFREDLYYRLKVVDLHLPTLKERGADIPELVGMFISQFNPILGLNIQGTTHRAMEAIAAYEWPGNIRELRNSIHRAMLFCDDAEIDVQHLPAEVVRLPA